MGIITTKIKISFFYFFILIFFFSFSPSLSLSLSLSPSLSPSVNEKACGDQDFFETTSSLPSFEVLSFTPSINSAITFRSPKDNSRQKCRTLFQWIRPLRLTVPQSRQMQVKSAVKTLGSPSGATAFCGLRFGSITLQVMVLIQQKSLAYTI